MNKMLLIVSLACYNTLAMQTQDPLTHQELLEQRLLLNALELAERDATRFEKFAEMFVHADPKLYTDDIAERAEILFTHNPHGVQDLIYRHANRLETTSN